MPSRFIDTISIKPIIQIAEQAGEILMNYYNNYDFNIDYKHDSSPVTCADIEANNFICNQIMKIYPDIPIISEEDHDSHQRKHSLFWSIDPLDATKSFIDKNGEFTVNIGLVYNSQPILGVIYAPLSKQLYYCEQKYAYKKHADNEPIFIRTREIPEEGATMLVSALSQNKEKVDQYFKGTLIKEIIPFSSALKICLIAEGIADIYPRFGQTMEWDTAAAHAILNAAGGSIKDLEGNHLTYGHNEKQYYNPHFIAKGK